MGRWAQAGFQVSAAPGRERHHETAVEGMISSKEQEAHGQFDLFGGGDDDGDSTPIGLNIQWGDEEWDRKTKLAYERRDRPSAGNCSGRGRPGEARPTGPQGRGPTTRPPFPDSRQPAVAARSRWSACDSAPALRRRRRP
ncbi:hypothetical protein GCM10028793_10710 [Nocardiopsis oceani]